jgi:hypothetical protein
MSPVVFFVLIIAAVIAIAIAAAVWSARMRDKRRQEMAGWAQANGLKFLPAKDHSVWLRYQAFKCLQRGENRYAYNIMLGTIGERVTCGFDYHYETHSTNSKGSARPITTTSPSWWWTPTSPSSRSSSAPRASSTR